MITQDLTQGSEEWKEFRNKRLGASDAAAILGISPWVKPYDLWLKKTGRAEDQRATPAMLRGNRLEEQVRQYYEQESGELMMPNVVVHPEYDFIMASLDGVSADGKVLLEIKCPKKEVYEKACLGEVVPHYYCQIQHQLACVPDAERCDYVVFWNDQYITVPVKRDEGYIADLMEQEVIFWNEYVLKDVAPPSDEEDYVQIDDPTLETLELAYQEKLTDYNATYCEYKQLKDELNDLRQSLLDLTDDGNCTGKLFRYTKKYRKSYDYKAACVDQKINLDQYEKVQVRWDIKPL